MVGLYIYGTTVNIDLFEFALIFIGLLFYQVISLHFKNVALVIHFKDANTDKNN